MTLADGELTPPEQELRRAMITGGWVDLRKHDPQADDPSQGAHWGPERTIRADVLADLVGVDPRQVVHHEALHRKPSH